MKIKQYTPHPAKLGATFAGALMIGSLLTAGTAGAVSAAGETPHASTNETVTVLTAVGPDYNWQQLLIPSFEKATGIKVNYDAIPEASIATKLQVDQEARSTAYSIFEDPESFSSTYLALHGSAPLTSYINNPSLTPASYDFKGISVGEEGQCTLKGVLYCLPVQLDAGPQMFYNKALFHAAGISSPPTSWAQVLTDAKKLTTPSRSVSGICMRGSETGGNNYPFFLSYPYFVPYAKNYQAEFLNQNWQPFFNSPQALSWATTYADLMQDYAPTGVSSYDYTDCQHALSNGQTAMWWDDASLESLVANPATSKDAKEIGYDEIPCPSFNTTCLLSAPWGMYINPNVPSGQQTAAWKFMEYVTSPSNQIKAMTETLDPSIATRTSSLTYAIAHNSATFKAPADFLSAMKYALSHIEANAIPVTPAFTPMVNDINPTLSALATNELSPQKAMSQLQSEIKGIVSEYHLK
jgi:ABC-type glycerol-3-phosphate transport system substrate-binding protein